MKKLLAIFLAALLACASANAQEPIAVSGENSDTHKTVGILLVEDGADGFYIQFHEPCINVVVSHTSGVSLSRKAVSAGEAILVYSYIPDTLPNLSVSYSLPGDETGAVYTHMISQSGKDSSYILVTDWYTENAWLAAMRLSGIMADDALLRTYTQDEEILGIIEKIRSSSPSEMPRYSYFISLTGLEKVVASMADAGEMHEENRKYLMRSMPSVILNGYIAAEGMLAAAVNGILKAEECMILPDIPFEPGFIVFDDGLDYAFVVSVTLAGEGIVRFQANAVSRNTLSRLSEMEAYLLGMMP